MLNTVRSAIPLLLIGALALVGAIVLAGLGTPVPAELWAIAFGAITGGAGVTIPSHAPIAADPVATDAPGSPLPAQQPAPGVVAPPDPGSGA